MSKIPFLSVIIPHHNRPGMLQETISSIPDRSDIEIVVVDDHSDELPRPKDTPSKACLRIYSNGPGGQFAGTARNFGVVAARGEFVYFADSDDLIDGAGMEACLDRLKERNTDVLYSKSDSFRASGAPGNRHHRYNALVDSFLKTGKRDLLVRFHSPWGKFIRRQFILEHGLKYQPTRVSNDVMFNASLFFAHPHSKAMDVVTYHIREGNPSLTSSPTPASIAERLGVLAQYNALLRQHGMGHLQVPAIAQVKSIFREHPIKSAELLVRGRLQGIPVIGNLSNLMRVLSRRLKGAQA